MTSTQRAAVLMLLLGEEQASDIIRFLNPKEVQALGAAMVQVQDLSQEAINVVLDEFVATIKNRPAWPWVPQTMWKKYSSARWAMTKRPRY